jgi:hypothetical protein
VKKPTRRAKRPGATTATPKPSAKAKTTKSIRVPDPADRKGGRIVVQVPADAGPAGRTEAAAFVRTLAANKQIARGEPMPPGATHEVETDAAGRKHLVRKRFSAI